ncbi:MAG TPA: hypothetical protein VLU92_14610 [Candidatus Dormibacteraeota bacterium]|nr:hypothetical protein [Candidatus Dormibacteraeota bacterium]
MNKRPGQLNVFTEVGYCPFCERPRNLRREERHLGALVRMTLTCETCHRTLESSMGVGGEEKPAEAARAKKAPAPSTAAATKKRAPAKKAASGSPAAAKPKAKASTPAKTRAATAAKRPAKGK